MSISKKPRCFCIVSYLSEEQLLSILDKKSSQIRNCAYIYHDKDEEIPHFHILIYLYNGHTVESIRNWFYRDGFLDDKGLQVNSFVEITDHISNYTEYLTHNTEKSISDGKHIYDLSEVRGWNYDFFYSAIDDPDDNLTMAIEDLICGFSLYECVKRYGRDFIIHYGHIKLLLNDMEINYGGNQK